MIRSKGKAMTRWSCRRGSAEGNILQIKETAAKQAKTSILCVLQAIQSPQPAT
jgi:hypothetical protein